MEHELDVIIKGCSIYSMLNSFDKAVQIEESTWRIEILKIFIRDKN